MKIRTKSMLGLVGLGLLMLAATEADDHVESVKPPEPKTGPGEPPGQVPMPQGYKRYRGTVSTAMTRAAVVAVNDPTSTFGDLIPGGQFAETGKRWGVLIEWHYHEPGQGLPVEGWHKGATLVAQS